MKNFNAFFVAIFAVACGGQVDRDHSQADMGLPNMQDASNQNDGDDLPAQNDAYAIDAEQGQSGSPSTGGASGTPSAVGGSATGGVPEGTGTGGIMDPSGGEAGTDEAGGSGGTPSDGGTLSDGGNSAAGSATADGGASGSNAVPSCESSLWVAVAPYDEREIDLGCLNIPMLKVNVTAGECEDILIHTLRVQLVSPDVPDDGYSSLYCREPCEDPGDWNFTNVTVRTVGNQSWGPIPFERHSLVSPSDGFVIMAGFIRGDNMESVLTVQAGQTVQLIFSMNITATEAVPIVGKRFLLFLTGFGAYNENTEFVEAEFEEDPPERYILITDSDNLRDVQD